MVINKFISCQTCNEKINIRIQAEDNRIPFIINCPECSTQISVEIDLSKNKQLKVNNASEIQNNLEFPMWCVELSSRFPVRKMFVREDIGLSPFFTTLQQFENGEIEIFISVMNEIEVLNERVKKGIFEDFLRINNLFMNGNEKYFLIETQKLLPFIENYTAIAKVNNLLDGVMVLHQNFILSGINILLKDEDLDEYIDISKKIIYSVNNKELLKYYSQYEKTINQLETRSYSLVNDFFKLFPQLSPVVILIKSNKYDDIDQEKYGISTAIYRDLKEFYASSYEWLLDALDIVIALNNIFERQDYSKCLKNKDFNNELQMINSKFQKIDMFISDDEPFSKSLTNINNKIRNAIQHYSDEIDYINQKIYFYDKHRGKTRVDEISLMDFAKLCIENFDWIIYIMELIYNLQKLALILNKELKPSLQFTRIRRKVGRNDHCPCGSGKKYKWCCGRNI